MKYSILIILIFYTSILFSQKYYRVLEIDSIHTLTIVGDSSLSRYRITAHSLHSKEFGKDAHCVIDTLWDSMTNIAVAPTKQIAYKLFKSKYFFTVFFSDFDIGVYVYEFNGLHWVYRKSDGHAYGTEYSTKAILKDDMSVEIKDRRNTYLLQFHPETKSFTKQKIPVEKH